MSIDWDFELFVGSINVNIGLLVNELLFVTGVVVFELVDDVELLVMELVLVVVVVLDFVVADDVELLAIELVLVIVVELDMIDDVVKFRMKPLSFSGKVEF